MLIMVVHGIDKAKNRLITLERGFFSLATLFPDVTSEISPLGMQDDLTLDLTLATHSFISKMGSASIAPHDQGMLLPNDLQFPFSLIPSM